MTDAIERRLICWHRKVNGKKPRKLFFSLSLLAKYPIVAEIRAFCKEHQYPPPILKMSRNSEGLFSVNSVSWGTEEDFFDKDLEYCIRRCLNSIAYELTTEFPTNLRPLLKVKEQPDETRIALYFNHDDFAPVAVFRPPMHFEMCDSPEMLRKQIKNCNSVIVFAKSCIHPSLHYDAFLACLDKYKTVELLDIKPKWIAVISHASDYGLQRAVAVHLNLDIQFSSPQMRAYAILLLHDYFANKQVKERGW